MPPIEAAATWITAVASGSLVTIMMTLAVASLAISLLFGQISMRRGSQIVVGCFILASSAQIAGALTGSITHNDHLSVPPRPAPTQVEVLQPLGPEPTTRSQSGNPFDPYAGAKPVQ